MATELISTVPPWLQADQTRSPPRSSGFRSGTRSTRRFPSSSSSSCTRSRGSLKNRDGRKRNDYPARISDPDDLAEDVKDNQGSFTIEPLDKGFGYTYGNSLRRVLLSSLKGAGITSVRIEGVAHEFSSIPGVKEDVTDIILNLKDIVVRMHTDADMVEVPLVATGPGEITAGDLEVPAGVEILNPEARSPRSRRRRSSRCT